MTAVFLCRRLADYFYQCICHFSQKYEVRVIIITTPPDPNAPFQYASFPNVEILPIDARSSTEWISFINNLQPNLIYLAGWADKLYKQIAKHYTTKIPVVMGLDAQWNGTAKQNLGKLAAPLVVKPYCNKVWIAGLYQFEFVRKLGFAKNQIVTGVYAANTSLWHKKRTELRSNYHPKKQKTLLYVGRLVEVKNIQFLIQTFQNLTEAQRHEWRLLIVGAGPLLSDLKGIAKENVVFQDFVSPDKLPDLLSECDAFCLPSFYEPWGVVIHEAAAMGLPMLISDACGAATEFLIEGFNGYSFSAHDSTSLQKRLIQLFSLEDKALLQMGQNSYTLSQRITLDTWAATCAGLLQER